MAEPKKVSVLLTLELPTSFDTGRWPAHMVIDHSIAGGIWGGLDAAIRMGITTPGEGSHVVALTFDEKTYPDWLPKTTLAGPWCSRVIMPILEHSWKGDEQDGIQLSPIGDEQPRPYVEPDSVRVTLRGKPVGEPIFRDCELQGVGWGCQGKIEIQAASVVFTAYRFLIDRDKLQEEFDHIVEAGDVWVTGKLENGGFEGNVVLDVIVEQWAAVLEGNR